MKKTIILLFVAVAFFITAVSPIYAGKESSLFPSWFTNAIKPIQNSINSLFQRTNNHEERIAELEKKVDFNIPNQWSVAFYQTQNGLDLIVMQAPEPKNSDLYILVPNPPYCNWNGAMIGAYVTARAVAHLPTGDIYGAGSCKEIEFRSIDKLPESGSSFEVEVYLWWQGTEKHKKQTITVPERPFTTYGLLN